jgi:hypothetical protein
MYETGEWQTDFSEVTMRALKRVPTINAASIAQPPSPHIQQRYIATRTPQKGLKGKLRMYLEKISWDLEEEKELWL